MSASEFTNAAVKLVWMAKFGCYHGIFDLSGTPLHETIIAAMDIIPAFQKKYKLQIVNSVFLTDGESNREGRIDYLDTKVGSKEIRPFVYTYKSNKSKVIKNDVILVDPVSRHEVKLNGYFTDISISLTKLLKYRTGCNTIGFYILSLREIKNLRDRQATSLINEKSIDPNKYYSSDDLLSDDDILEFRKNKHVIMTNQGYDEYYLMKSDADVTEDEFVCNSKTNRGIASAFSKYAGNKINNRVVLNRFIKLIS
jgi:hypothetical protein